MKYEKPAMEIMAFEEQDVITLSLGGSDDEFEYPKKRTIGSDSF
jgi:hypothetical protein